MSKKACQLSWMSRDSFVSWVSEGYWPSQFCPRPKTHKVYKTLLICKASKTCWVTLDMKAGPLSHWMEQGRQNLGMISVECG